MKINILIKDNLDKIYNILKNIKKDPFLSNCSKNIQTYNWDNAEEVFKKALKDKDSKIFVFDEAGYLPFLFFSKQKGVAASLGHCADAAKLARAHNDSRVCVIPYNRVKRLKYTPSQIIKIMKTFLTTKFEGGRHATRISIMHDSFKKATQTIKFNSKSKTIVLCCDHAGFKAKNVLKTYLTKHGYKVLDVGTYSNDSTHYSMYAIAAALHAKECLTIISVCFTGAGICNTLNKFKGINAFVCLDTVDAWISKLYGANVLALSAKYTETSDLKDIVKKFLDTEHDDCFEFIHKYGFSFDKSKFKKIKLEKNIVVPKELK